MFKNKYTTFFSERGVLPYDLTLKTSSAIPTQMANICGKFHWILPSR